MLRRRGRPEPEPAAGGPHPLQGWAAGLPPRWQRPVHDALSTREQFLQVAAQAPAGPTRDRLDRLGATVEEAVQRVAEAAWRASNAETLAANLDVRVATEELKAARRELEQQQTAGVPTDAAEQRVAALAERHRAVNDALNLADDAGARLGELNVRLQTAVARAATVVLRAAQDDRLEELDRELSEVVVGLRALDEALGELP
jgi:hypothetical protein